MFNPLRSIFSDRAIDYSSNRVIPLLATANGNRDGWSPNDADGHASTHAACGTPPVHQPIQLNIAFNNLSVIAYEISR